MNSQKHDRQQGFTLVELMVVVVILGLLSGIGAVAFIQYKKDADIDVAKIKCAELEKAIESFALRNPNVEPDEVLEAMIEDKKIKSAKDIKDPWGEDYIVRRDDDGNFVVISKGEDRAEDSEDDIGSRGKLSENEDF